MKRITNHPVLGKLDESQISVTFNGTCYSAIEGDSIASALLANDVRTIRRTRQGDEARGVYCGIGHCYECRLVVDGTPSVRACITLATDGMILSSTDYSPGQDPG